MNDSAPNPGEFWVTAKGRTVEILARSDSEDVIAYQFLGARGVRLRAIPSLADWERVEFE